jgi:hypothetical protein
MTTREAAIVSAYTGYLIGDFNAMHEYVQNIMGRPVYTHEMGSDKFFDELHEKCKADFIKIKIND